MKTSPCFLSRPSPFRATGLLLALALLGYHGLSVAAEPAQTPPTAPAGVQGKINLDDLCQPWVHAQEEEQPGAKAQIYRPAASKKFPPSRFRMTYRFTKEGKCDWLYLDPADAHRIKSGKWVLDPKDPSLLHITTEGKTVSLKIIELTREILRLAPVEASQPGA